VKQFRRRTWFDLGPRIVLKKLNRVITLTIMRMTVTLRGFTLTVCQCAAEYYHLFMIFCCF